MKEQQPIVVNLPEGQNTLTILQGEAPVQLDQQAPVKIDIKGVIYAPLNFLDKRVKDIDSTRLISLFAVTSCRFSLLSTKMMPTLAARYSASFPSARYF